MYHPKGPSFFELARQALSSTEKGYDLLAPKFEYTPFRTPDKILEPVFSLIGEPVDAALDICCGTGAAMKFLQPLCRKRLVGLDSSKGMLEQARARITGENPAPEWVIGNANDLPFNEEFDLAVCFGALGHIPVSSQPHFVRSIARALKPGGRFVFVTGYMPSARSVEYWLGKGFNGAMHLRNLFWPKKFVMYYLTFLLPQCKHLLEENGFTVEVSEDLFKGTLSPLKAVVATRS